MKPLKIIARKSLAAGELLRLPGGRGLALEVVAGMVWLTMPGKGEDLLIERGRRVALTRGGLALAEAVRPAEVNVVAHSDYAQRARATGIGRLAESVRRWLRRARARSAGA